MRKALLYFFLLSFLYNFSQKKQNILENFDFTGMETSILVQKSPLINLDEYNNNGNNIYDFYQGFKAISQSDLQHRLINVADLKNQTKQSYFNNIIPLSILVSEYETIKNEAFKNGNVSNDNKGFLIRTNNSAIFQKHQLNIASTLRINYKGLTVNFELKQTNIFNTTSNKITDIQIDFGNGEGFKNIVLNKEINISYLNAGHKTLTYQITFENGSIKSMQSVIEINYSNEDLNTLFARSPSTFTSTIIPDLSVYGETSYAGEGEYEIFLSTEDNAVLDKPIFVVDGFDPSDNHKIIGYTDSDTGEYNPGIYDFFYFVNSNNEGNNLLDLIREEGFDIVILNFPIYTRDTDNTVIDGGVDYIERNAMLLVELINQINNQKVGNAQNVVIGPSMGGLISQYALNFMENQAMNHDTRLWIAFDSPLHGANVPIGFQHQFNYLANGLDDFWFIGNQNVEALQPVVNGMMKSNAARQMLTDQLESHITNSDNVSFNSNLALPQKHPFYNIFFNSMHELTNSGFPEIPRKISIINGSGLAHFYQDKNGDDIIPGRVIVDVDIDVESGVEAFLDVNFTTYADSSVEVSSVYIDFAWYIPAFDVESYANSQSYSYSDGIDAAPGGLFDISAVTSEVGTTGIAGEFVTALQTDYFNFIPAVSAMATEFNNNEIDWFHHTNNTNTALETPFDAWYIPDENERHVTLTQANVDFAWNEIVLQDFASNQEHLITNIKIINPIKNDLVIYDFSSQIKNITILDVNGKVVFKREIQNSSDKLIIPISLNTGIYFAKIQGVDNTTNRKLIIQ